MSIDASSILLDGTVSATGGTATNLLVKKTSGNTSVAFLDDSSEYLNQKTVEFTARDANVLSTAPNGYTQRRNIVLIKFPLNLDNGNRTFNTLKLELACDVETTDAERLTMRSLAGQILSDSDFTEFWNQLSIT